MTYYLKILNHKETQVEKSSEKKIKIKPDKLGFKQWIDQEEKNKKNSLVIRRTWPEVI